jgi:type I restriction enzyme S subunit
MNRIEKLISRLCPNGVPYSPIGDFAECISGATPSSTVTRFWENGTIPWMSSGEVNKEMVYETDTFITQEGFDSCSTKMVPAGSVVMALAGQGKTRGMVARIGISLCTNQSLCSIISNERVLSDYLYHFLKGQYQTLRSLSSGDGGRGGLNLQIIRSFKIPVPPIEVQQEIVSILDKFTELEDNLASELEARESQYHHYRKNLLSLRDVEAHKVRLIPMGQLLKLQAGKFISATEISQPAETKLLYPCYGGNGLRGYVPNFSHDGEFVLIGRQGALSGNVKRTAGKFYATEHAIVVTPNEECDIRWLYHVLTEMNLNQYVSKGAQPGLAVGNLEKVEIAVPPPEIQRSIGAILDGFDKLVNDHSDGLPAEIKARNQQYEHYRSKLLTFKELGVA